MPLTEGQLKSKRDEFWDTAPAFEGKAEIWAALKAATEATEMQPEADYQLAQVELFVLAVSHIFSYLMYVEWFKWSDLAISSSDFVMHNSGLVLIAQ